MSETILTPQLPAIARDDEINCLESEAGQAIANFDTELIPASHKKLFASLVPGKGNQVLVLPEDIRIIPGFNPRLDTEEYRAHLRNIADSIKAEGYYQDKPLSGYAGMDGKKPVVFLTEGQTRFKSGLMAIAEGAPLEYFPLVLKPEGTSLEDLTVGLVRSNQGLGFTPLELAIICARLKKFNWKTNKIAEKLGFTVEYVSQLLSLAAAPHAVRKMIEDGNVKAGVAIQAIREHGSEAAAVLEKAAEQAKASGKPKVTRQHLPSAIRKKALTKVAPRMFDALEQITKHNSYQELPEDLREMVDALISDVAQATNNEAESEEPKGETTETGGNQPNSD